MSVISFFKDKNKTEKNAEQQKTELTTELQLFLSNSHSPLFSDSKKSERLKQTLETLSTEDLKETLVQLFNECIENEQSDTLLTTGLEKLSSLVSMDKLGQSNEAVLNEAKAAGRFLVLIQAHDDAVQRPALAEQLVDLLLCCMERQVANVHRG